MNQDKSVRKIFQEILKLEKNSPKKKIHFTHIKDDKINLAIDFGKKTFIVNCKIMPKIKEKVLGITARTINGEYVLFWDYDSDLGLTKEEIIGELEYLQEKHKLTDIFLFESSPGSYHAICCTLFPLIQAYNILRESSCSMAFVNAAKFYQGRTWILRFGRKANKRPPLFVQTIPSMFERRQSLSHLRFLQKYYGIPVSYFSLQCTDNCDKICFVEYKTGSRLK
jgi:hypothetical protein